MSQSSTGRYGAQIGLREFVLVMQTLSCRTLSQDRYDSRGPAQVRAVMSPHKRLFPRRLGGYIFVNRTAFT